MSFFAMTTGTIDIDKAYAGVSNAETGSYANPYIRTIANNAPGGSTAFGPVQITYKLAQGAAKNGYLSPESQAFYNTVLKPRYELMLKNGNNKGQADYNPAFDYGGHAEFNPNQHAQDYERFAKEVMIGIAKESGNNEKKFIEKWRGKSIEEDPQYYKRFIDGKSKFTNFGIGNLKQGTPSG